MMREVATASVFNEQMGARITGKDLLLALGALAELIQVSYRHLGTSTESRLEGRKEAFVAKLSLVGDTKMVFAALLDFRSHRIDALKAPAL